MFHAPFSRRRFVAAGAAFLALGPLEIADAFADSMPLDAVPVDDLRRDVGTVLRLSGEEGAIDACVVEVTEERSSGPYRAVALHLQSDDFLPQGVHRVRHPRRGESTLLVVPVVHPADDPDAPDLRDGRYAYQITFVRDARA